MSFEETLRLMMREELKSFLRTELLPLLADARCAKQEEDGYLAIQRAAEFADVHPDTIRVWIKAGRLRGYHAGRELRVLRSDLRRFLEVGDVVEGRPTAEEEAAMILGRSRSG